MFLPRDVKHDMLACGNLSRGLLSVLQVLHTNTRGVWRALSVFLSYMVNIALRELLSSDCGSDRLG